MRKAERPLGVNEIAAELGCSERTVRRLYKNGTLPAYKAGGRTSPIRMDRKALAQLKKKRGAV
ncbi:helix-turn-helix domain-containing protein [Martelella mediterranea]|uniref:DNA binding domain, excisionase family n=1 Tax=Martelella mediterranea DSM 17316 TaxID=1122214 RepID=A0A1U9YYV4_9HYPH|nr:helix-turn-helix domain-containing protein [Martelella mediterranea]AQZ50542.1 DNA binding domain, excisionase family [Martelella mediterranea DSM 17316]